MNGDRRQARRYHWLSEGMTSFVEQPHAAIEGQNQGNIINLTDHRAERSRCKQIELLGSVGPERIAREAAALSAGSGRERDGPTTAHDRSPEQAMLPHLVLPAHHDVRASDVHLRRLHGNLAAAAERGPADFPDLLLTPGVGARTVRALALVAEVLHGAPCRFSDPARFSLAHGGKDRHPFPVPIKVYDETIRVLRTAVDKAKLGREERLFALRKLDAESRRLERAADGPSLDSFVAGEFAQSHEFGGRSVFGWEPPVPAVADDKSHGSGRRPAAAPARK
jgi:hypothetical protein